MGSNIIQQVFVSQPPLQQATLPQTSTQAIMQSVATQQHTEMEPVITQPETMQSADAQAAPIEPKLPKNKQISKFFCDFGECKLSFESVEELR